MSVGRLISALRARLRGVYRGWWIALVCYWTQLVTAGAGVWVFGVLLLSMQHDFGWSQTTIIGVLTLERLISGALSLVLGPFADRHGARVLMAGSSVLAAASLVIVAFSWDVVTFYLGWGLYGLAQPGVGLLGPRVALANWFVRKRAQAFVLFTMGSASAGILAVPAAAWVDVHYGWRPVWLVMAVMALSIAPLAWWAVRRRPEDLGLLPDGDPVVPEGSAAARCRAIREAPWTVRQALHTRAFWLVTLGFLLIAMPSGTIMVNISGYVQSLGFRREEGASVVAAFGIGVLCGRFVWGGFLARLGLYRTLVLFAANYGLTILLFALQHSLMGLYGTAFLVGAGGSGGQQINAQTYADYYGRAIIGSLTGFSQLANVMIAGGAPLVASMVFDATGSYVPAFLFFAAACGGAALAFLLSRPPVHPSLTRGGGIGGYQRDHT